MATYSVNDIINKTLVAKDNVLGYFDKPRSERSQLFRKNEIIGRVYSWVKDPKNTGQIFWMIEQKDGKYMYVFHDSNRLTISEPLGKSQQEKEKEAEEQTKKDEKGMFVYYFEKYGKIVLLSGLGLAVFKVVYNKYNPSK